MTFIKLIAGSLLTLVLLIALAILIAPRVIDPNDYRDNIAAVVKSKTGRDLRLEGDLRVSVFPWLGVRTQGLGLSQPAEIGGDMLTVQTAQLRVKLLPLLSKRLEIDTVILENPQVRLITLKNGVNSFTGLSENGAAEEVKKDNSADAASAVALVIQGLELTDGSLSWEDRQSGQQYQVNELNLNTGNLLGEEFASIAASGNFIDASAAAPLAFEVLGKARIDTDSLQLLGEDLVVDLRQEAQSLRFEVAAIRIDQRQGLLAGKMTLTADLLVSEPGAEPQTAKVTAQIAELDYNFNSGQLTAMTTSAGFDARWQGQPSMVLKASLPKILFNTATSRLDAKNIGVQGDIGGRLMALSIPQFEANLDAQTASADTLQLDSEDLSAVIDKLRLKQIFDQPAASGLLQIKPFNAAQFVKDLGLDYSPADKNVLQSVGLNTRFEASMQKLGLSGIDLLLDQSRMTGVFEAQNFDSPRVSFELVLNRLNLDQYLPAAADTANTSNAESVSGAAALAIPMALLKDINANGSFKADQLISGGLQLDAVDVQIVSTPGTLTITPKADLYDGKLGGNVVFSEGADKSQLRINNKVDLVSLAKLLSAAEVSDQISGIGSLEFDILVTEKDGMQSNEGTIKLFAKEGAIKGVDIKQIVDQAYQAYQQLRGKAVEESGDSEASDETRFAELLGTFYLKDFKLSNKDFLMKAPLFQVAGSGDIDLAAERIDYLVNVAITNDAAANAGGGEAWQKLAGLSIPVRFGGSLFAPNYKLDLKELYKGLAKKEIDEEKSKFLQENLGIEDGGKLSTSELLQQILINKAEKKSSKKSAETGTANTSTTPASSDYYPGHEPTGESAREVPSTAPPGAAVPGAAAPEVYADPGAEPQAGEDEKPEPTRKELREERKKRLLESIFN